MKKKNNNKEAYRNSGRDGRRRSLCAGVADKVSCAVAEDRTSGLREASSSVGARIGRADGLFALTVTPSVTRPSARAPEPVGCFCACAAVQTGTLLAGRGGGGAGWAGESGRADAGGRGRGDGGEADAAVLAEAGLGADGAGGGVDVEVGPVVA